MNWSRPDRSGTPLARLAAVKRAGVARIANTRPVSADLSRIEPLTIREARVDHDGMLVLEYSDGTHHVAGRVKGDPGLDGYTPRKDKDYFDGKPGPQGVSITGAALQGLELTINLSTGRTVKVGRVVGDKGDDGYTPVKGKDYFDGEPGKTPKKGVDYFDGKPGATPVKGKDYDDGDRGIGVNGGLVKNGHLYLILTTGESFDCGPLPVVDPLPPPSAIPGDDGEQGPIGHTPRNEVKGESVRFAQKMSKDGAKVLAWGEWLHLGRMVKDLMRKMTPGHAGGVSEARVLQLIEENMSTSPLAGYRIADEDSAGTIKYYGNTKTDAKTWYILRVDDTVEPAAYRYAADSAVDYPTAWAARASQTYVYFHQLTLA